MTTQLIPRFSESVNRNEGEVIRTDADSLRESLERILKTPAVATPIPFVEFDFTDIGITTTPTAQEVKEAAMGITAGQLGIADYGSIVLSAPPDETEPVSLYPDHHVAILKASNLVTDMPTAIKRMVKTIRTEQTDLVIATGPSATADMGALVYGAHGPRDVTVLLIEDQ